LAAEYSITTLDLTYVLSRNDSGMNSITSLTSQQLRQAASIKERIDALNKQLNQLLGATAPAASGAAPKRTMSAAARAKIRAAAKARWARWRQGKAGAKPAASAAAPAKKSKMSPAAKAKLSARMKAIWAARKAGKK